jgi:hypothetical protein
LWRVNQAWENFKGVVRIDVGVHRDCVGGVHDRIKRDLAESAEVTKQLPSVLKISGTKMNDLLQMLRWGMCLHNSLQVMVEENDFLFSLLMRERERTIFVVYTCLK